jgi:hypothetical protein
VADAAFAIPPGDPTYSAKASATLASDVNLVAVAPHMHLRGKAMDMRAIYPTGESETLFNVPDYDFNWQLLYEFPAPKVMPLGTKIEVTATWDNSANNRFNPDPKAEVRWGDQSWDEMLLGLMTLQIEPNADLDKLFQPRPRPEQRAAADR